MFLFGKRLPIKLVQLSTAGADPGLRKPWSPPAGGETPRRIICATEKRGEKSDSFSRGKRTRPLSPCKPFSASKISKTFRWNVFDVLNFHRSSTDKMPKNLKNIRCKRPTGTFTKLYLLKRPYKAGRSCSPRLEKAVAFSHHPLRGAKECAGVFRRCGGDQGFSPWTSPAFLKNCWIKKLHCRLRHC